MSAIDNNGTAQTGELVPAAATEVTDLVPKAPQNMDATVLEAIDAEARQLAEQVTAEPDNLQVLSQLTRLGEDAQSKVSSFLEMRRVTVADMMKKVGDGTHNPLPDHIHKMRDIMEKFDPRPFKEQLELARQYGGKGIKNAIVRKLRGIPVLGKLLKNIADQFQPISDEIDGLLMAMDGGLVRLDENNAAIMTQTDELKVLIGEVEQRAYQAELVFGHLKKMHAEAPEDGKQKIMNAMSRISKRALFLRSNEQIFLQVLTGLRTSITTNFELRDTVSMLRDQAAPLLTNLYALIVVQQDSRRIAESAAATQEMVTDLLQTGAEMTRDNVAYVGELGVKMVSEMDKLIASKQTFLEAVAKADQLAEQTVAAATKSIPVFQTASEELKKVVRDHEGADAVLNET